MKSSADNGIDGDFRSLHISIRKRPPSARRHFSGTPHAVRFRMWDPGKGIEFCSELSTNPGEPSWTKLLYKGEIGTEIAAFSEVLERLCRNSEREKVIEMFEPLLLGTNDVLDSIEGEFKV